MIQKMRVVFLSISLVSFISCPTTDNGNNEEKPNNNPPATVNFYNESSFRIDIQEFKS